LFTRERAEESERSQLCAAKRVMLSGDGEREGEPDRRKGFYR